MIINNLMNRLVNQLFQILLSIDNNDKFGFDFDSCQTNNQVYFFIRKIIDYTSINIKY